jgi:hypothetical protein
VSVVYILAKNNLSLLGAVVSGVVTALLLFPVLNLASSILYVGLSALVGFGLAGLIFTAPGSDAPPLNQQTTVPKSTVEPRAFLLSSSDVFVGSALFLAALVVYFVPSMGSSLIWADWFAIPATNYLRAVAAIVLSTFVPGYFLIRALDWGRRFSGLEILVLSFLLSLFVVPLASVLASAMGFTLVRSGVSLLLGLNLLMFLVYVVACALRFNKSPQGSTKMSLGKLHMTFRSVGARSGAAGREGIYFAISIAGVLGLVLALSYRLVFFPPYLIGDQWPHHAVARLYEMYGNQVLATKLEPYYVNYPQWFHIYLASLFSVSGVPSTNTCFMINFMNAFGLLALYLLARSFFKRESGSVGALAMALALFSGFGWVYDLWLRVVGAYPGDVLMRLYQTSISTYDVAFANTYFGSAHPELTSDLQVMALPALLMLLMLTNRSDLRNRASYVLVSLLVALAFLAHVAEGGMFIAILLSGVVFSRGIAAAWRIAVAALAGIALAGGVGLILTDAYYLSLTAFYAALILSAATVLIAILGQKLPKRSALFSVGLRRVRVALIAAAAACAVWFGLLLLWRLSGYSAFNVWWDCPRCTLTVPPYMYPVRFGILGFLAIPAILLVGIVWKEKVRGSGLLFGFAAVAAALGRLWMFPQLFRVTGIEEFRWNKYLALALAIPVAFFLWRCLRRPFELRRRWAPLLGVFLVAVILVAGLASTFLYAEFTTLAYTGPVPKPEPKIQDYPAFNLIDTHSVTPDELAALQFLVDNLPRDRTVAITGSTTWSPQGFPYAKVTFLAGLLQNQTVSLRPYYSLNSSDIILTKMKAAKVRYVYLSSEEILFLSKYPALQRTIMLMGVAFRNSQVTIFTLQS